MSRAKKTLVQQYRAAHRRMKALDAASDVKADEVRDHMDALWRTMSEKEKSAISPSYARASMPIVVKDTGKKWKEVSALDVAMKRSAALSKERRAFKKLDEMMLEHEVTLRARRYVEANLLATAGGKEGLQRIVARADARLRSARLAWARAVGVLAKLKGEKKA